ncbi:hypothetical protein NLG97_g10909 [Lecanicillium saksenae]|uniref:Uncharacterized protein n=1 Tax=Lecanicillium saksenae TaxID=468837 RepID=A0ACC1QEU3_9HYPO|nr:hypothetical protein NLG97_g10909 [Lecanicillium saksenae]
MTPSVDAEFEAAIAPLRPMLSQIPTPAAHDIEARRRNMALFTNSSSPPPVPNGLTQDIISVTTADRNTISLWRVAKNPESGAKEKTLGPARPVHPWRGIHHPQRAICDGARLRTRPRERNFHICRRLQARSGASVSHPAARLLGVAAARS